MEELSLNDLKVVTKLLLPDWNIPKRYRHGFDPLIPEEAPKKHIFKPFQGICVLGRPLIRSGLYFSTFQYLMHAKAICGQDRVLYCALSSRSNSYIRALIACMHA